MEVDDPSPLVGSASRTPAPASGPATASRLSTMQLRTVDESFQRLFGYEWGVRFDLVEPQTRVERLLCHVLGTRAAATVLHHKSKHVVRAAHRPTPRHTVGAKAPPSSGARRPAGSRTSVTTPRAAVTATATVPTQSAEPASAVRKRPLASAPTGGVHAVLQALQEAEKTTTIAKTSADWELFKDKTGLGDKLEEKAESKDSYLNRQDFLTRVDHRTFELERKDRDKERAARGT